MTIRMKESDINETKTYKIPICNILGVNIAAINMDWLIQFLKRNRKALAGNYICVSNVHSTVMSYEDSEYCAIQNGGIMAIPDGGPLACIGKKRGFKNMARTTGPGLMEELFKEAQNESIRFFFYGSTENTLKKLHNQLTCGYPSIQIVGMYSPPFRKLTEEEDKSIVDIINASQPDIVFVGLGAPKQEIWMAAHQWKINALMIGVGAGFDYFAKNIKRAPVWMQRYNLEWLFRLLQEPRKLFKRYMKTNWKFILEAVIKGK